MYSEEIANAIKRYFKSMNMNCYEFDEEKGIFTYDFIPNSKIKRLHCNVLVDEISFRAISTLKLTITDERVESIIACLNKINCYTTSTNFVFDINKKEIYCQCYTNCNIIPTNDIIAKSLFSAMSLVKTFGDVIFDVVEGKIDDEQLDRLLEVYDVDLCCQKRG